MTPLILASASSVRRQLLQQAGLSFQVIPADVDETSLKKEAAVSGTVSPIEMAMKLAEEKAVSVSKYHENHLVIGSDQMLECTGRLFDKPENLSQAREHLVILRGKTHNLISGICCAFNGEVCWRHHDVATLTMRQFSDEFLESYLSLTENEITQTVGGYKLEGPGIQLFEKITGDYFTILGLPLLPLLAYLRTRNIVKT